GALVGLVIMATIAGMALGSWMSGAIFDLTGSYWQAFANGLAWNLLNIAIALVLLRRARDPPLPARRTWAGRGPFLVPGLGPFSATIDLLAILFAGDPASGRAVARNG